MAILKQRVHRMNESGSYDTIYYETSSEVVIRPDGTTVEQAVSDMITEVDALAALKANVASLWVWGVYPIGTPYAKTASASGERVYYYGGPATGSSYYIRYNVSSSVSVASDGTVSLVSPTAVDVYATGSNTASGTSDLLGKYFQYVSKSRDTIESAFTNGIFYCPSDSNFSISGSSFHSIVNSHIEQVIGVTASQASVEQGLIKYGTDIDPNAYPANGSSGDYWYVSLGQIGESFGGAKIETGSYVGTGTYGSSNPNSLTFGFVPKVIFIANTSNSSGGAVSIPYGGAAALSVGTRLLLFSWVQNTVSWYSIDDVEYQLNISGYTYAYVAVG